MCWFLLGEVDTTPPLCLAYLVLFSASLMPFANTATVNDPSHKIALRGGRCRFCPLCLWRSYRSARSSAAEEDAREDLEYYAAEDDESEENYLWETRMPG